MLKIKTTEHLTGVTVSGTYGDLNTLYDALSNVVGDEGCYLEYDTCRIHVLGLCYDIRHAYQGDRNISKNEIGEEVFSFECLWPEMVFIYAVLDDFTRLSAGSRCWMLQDDADKLFFRPETKEILAERMPDDISYVRYFQSLIKNALQRTIDPKRFKRIMTAYESGYSYTLIRRFFNNFCTQWIDLQNVKYLRRTPDKRKSYLATITEKILFDSSDYDALKRAVLQYARENNTPCCNIELEGTQYPEIIEW